MSKTPVIVALIAVGCAVLYFLFQKRKEPVRKVPHEYFSRVWLWPPGSHTRWEAELDAGPPGTSKTIGFYAEALNDEASTPGPTDAEVTFCKERLSRLDELFELCKPAIAKAWHARSIFPTPDDWRSDYVLDGLSAPKDGDPRNPWGVSYYCSSAGRTVSVEFRNGEPHLEGEGR
jgi:hypothetical protein